MPNLNLTGQTTAGTAIQTRIVQLKNLLDQRKPFWDRMPNEKKKAWVKSEKDPVMNLAWDVFKYLNNNFFNREDTNG